MGWLPVFYIFSRFIHFTALMLLFGGSLFVVLLSQEDFKKVLARRMTMLLAGSAIFSLISAVMLFVFEAGLIGEGWFDVWHTRIWLQVFATHFGQVWRWELVFAFLSCLILLLGRPYRNNLLLLTAAAQLITLGFVGHAAIHQGWFADIQHINAAIHLLSAAYWFGCLIPLFICTLFVYQTQQSDDARLAMKRFSQYGHVAVGLVIVSGIINCLLIIPRPYHWDALYLKLLLIKITLVLGMLVIAIYNRYILVPRIRVSATGRQKFISLIWVEWSLSLIVISLVSVFATLQP